MIWLLYPTLKESKSSMICNRNILVTNRKSVIVKIVSVVLHIFELICSVWHFQLILSSMHIPRNLVSDQVVICFPSYVIFISVVGLLLLAEN
jgi:hypothetical protein